ncbi:MAG: VOC family protein [Candidatus Eremiobacteraeota bacterium]|nr:VOC family protein [Candidatus Eremiobacteraeota bacterium]
MPPRIDGNVHVALVVSDAVRSAQWYGRVFGFIVVRTTVAETVHHVSGRHGAFTFTSLFHPPSRLFMGLAQPKDPGAAAFDWSRPGLQHFGFHVEERDELDAWSRHLDELGIEHSEVLSEGPGLLVRFHDPDQIPVEVYWPDGQYCEQLFTMLARSRASAARERRREKGT